MRNRVRLSAGLVAVGLLVAACGDDGGGDREASTETSDAVPSTTEAAVTTTTVLLEEAAFQEGDVQITLTWENGGDLDLWATGPVEGAEPELVGVGRENAGPPGGEYVPVAADERGTEFLGDASGPACGESSLAMERVFWPADEALSGEYSAWVEASDFETVEDCGAPIPYTLEVRVLGEEVASGTGEVSYGNLSEERIQFQVP